LLGASDTLYRGANVRCPPDLAPEQPWIRPNYSTFANKLPNNSAYFLLGEEPRFTNNNNTTMNNPSPAAPSSATSPRDCELKAYEVGAKVTDHIIALQASVVNVANFFIVITGALWVAVGTNQLKLPTYVSIILLCFHIIGAVATWQVLASHLYAIRLRFAFLKDFGPEYHPELEKIGENSFGKVFGSESSFRAKYARWRNAPPLLWYLIPIAALAGSVYFLTRVWHQ
jgi:hypothetical protein